MKKIRRVFNQMVRTIKQRDMRRKKIKQASLAFNLHQLEQAARIDQKIILMVK